MFRPFDHGPLVFGPILHSVQHNVASSFLAPKVDIVVVAVGGEPHVILVGPQVVHDNVVRGALRQTKEKVLVETTAARPATQMPVGIHNHFLPRRVAIVNVDLVKFLLLLILFFRHHHQTHIKHVDETDGLLCDLCRDPIAGSVRIEVESISQEEVHSSVGNGDHAFEVRLEPPILHQWWEYGFVLDEHCLFQMAKKKVVQGKMETYVQLRDIGEKLDAVWNRVDPKSHYLEAFAESTEELLASVRRDVEALKQKLSQDAQLFRDNHMHGKITGDDLWHRLDLWKNIIQWHAFKQQPKQSFEPAYRVLNQEERGEEWNNCFVCNQRNPVDNLRVVLCRGREGHTVHHSCIDRWFELQRSRPLCPMCALATVREPPSAMEAVDALTSAAPGTIISLFISVVMLAISERLPPVLSENPNLGRHFLRDNIIVIVWLIGIISDMTRRIQGTVGSILTQGPPPAY